VIHRLQTNQGADGFNNLLVDSRGPGASSGLTVDFAAHARSLGCHVEEVADGDIEGLRKAYAAARRAAVAEQRPAVVFCRVHTSTWTESGAWWETGTPASLSGRAAYDEGKRQQVRWV
jgi:3D-(3,5/4)-trihydroxycyclohexane-1,2-dione acylhydrolase (decyclizing)